MKTTNWCQSIANGANGEWCLCCLNTKNHPVAKLPKRLRIRAEICHADEKTGFSDTTVTVIRDCVYPFCGGTAQSGSLYDRLSLPSWSLGDTRTPWDSKTAAAAADEDEFECQHRLVTRRCFRFFLHPENGICSVFGLFEHTSLQHSTMECSHNSHPRFDSSEFLPNFDSTSILSM